MAYIGLPPKANFTSGLLDRFTSTTGTTVTLTHDISSENDIVVFVNFVKQDSTTYSVGGTGNKTLTLGGTLVSSDIVEVHYLNIVGQTNAPSSGSVGSSQLSADIITGQTALAVAPDSTDELLISDGGTLKRIDVSLVGGNNTPAWSVHSNADQSLTHQTDTLLAFQTELFDTDSAFTNTSSNYKFTVPSGKAGKYFVYAQSVAHNDTNHFVIKLYKNGSEFVAGTYFNYAGSEWPDYSSSSLSTIIDLAESDYLQIYAKHDRGTGSTSDAKHNIGGLKQTRFEGYKLIG